MAGKEGKREGWMVQGKVMDREGRKVCESEGTGKRDGQEKKEVAVER